MALPHIVSAAFVISFAFFVNCPHRWHKKWPIFAKRRQVRLRRTGNMYGMKTWRGAKLERTI